MKTITIISNSKIIMVLLTITIMTLTDCYYPNNNHNLTNTHIYCSNSHTSHQGNFIANLLYNYQLNSNNNNIYNNTSTINSNH